VLIKISSLLLSAIFLFPFPAPREEPELVAEKSIFDFGTVREGMNVPVCFTVFNRGSKEVIIQEVRTFAACVERRPLSKRSLPPGGKITLEYVFESLGYGGASINKPIEIHYNNRRLSPLHLNVRGTVLPLESYQASMGELTYNFFVLVDIRAPESFVKEHIIGAINVPLENISRWTSEAAKSISDELIIYLYSEDGTESDRAAKMLRTKGYSQFLSIVGGLKEWKNQNGRKFLVSGKS
jgi:rhodanese-related sulfurtransferase